jgi:hypothetical protein
MEPHLYNVDIAWTTDRKGVMCSPELAVANNSGGCIEVATPPEFPKGMPGIWSPEHAHGKLEQVDGKFLMTEVLLEPTVVVHEERDIERGLKVLQKAETNCLISNSVKAKVSMRPVVEVELVKV